MESTTEHTLDRSDDEMVLQVIRTGFSPQTITGRLGRLDWNRLVELLCHNDDRNELLVQRIILNLPKRTVVLVNRIEHTEKLAQLLSARDVRVHMITGYNRQEEVGEVDVIIATLNAIEDRFFTILRTVDVLLLSYSVKLIHQLNNYNFATHPGKLLYKSIRGGLTIQYVLDDHKILDERYRQFVKSLGIKRLNIE